MEGEKKIREKSEAGETEFEYYKEKCYGKI